MRHKSPRIRAPKIPGGRILAALAIFYIGPLYGHLYAANPHFITDFLRRLLP